MENIFIKGTIVSLRKPDIETDIVQGEWHQWFNDAEITKYLVHGVFPNDRESQKGLIEGELKRSNSLLLSIISNKTKKMVGVISLKSIDFINRNAEIGLVMGYSKEAGCAIEATALLTQHAFDRLNLLKLYGGQHAGLWKWVNTIGTIGYKVEGLRKNMGFRNGLPYDILLTAINKDDYYRLKELRGGRLFESIEALSSMRRRENVTPILGDFLSQINSTEVSKI